jgi:hypothetical protein
MYPPDLQGKTMLSVFQKTDVSVENVSGVDIARRVLYFG